MSNAGSAIPYHLRPNKVVEREIFVDLLCWLSGPVRIDQYRYIGLGGPFLEDFRLLHSRTAICKMTCVERERATHARQLFNRPVRLVDCVLGDLDEVLRNRTYEEPVICWLDFTDPKGLRDKLDLFCFMVEQAPSESILKITLNASPSGLGTVSTADADEMREARLQRLRNDLGDYLPASSTSDHVKAASYGPLLLSALKLALEKRLEATRCRFLGLNSFLYADGQQMVSATGITLLDEELEGFLARVDVRSWPYCWSEWWVPRVLDMPVLSARERLLLESRLHDDGIAKAEDVLEFALPDLALARNMDVLVMLREYYRHYPQFGRVSY